MVIILLAAGIGCSKEQIKRSSYEALHNVSDQQNYKSDRYESDNRMPYDVYQDKREETLKNNENAE